MLLQREGDGAAALHGDPGDGEHPPTRLLPPHPIRRVCQQVRDTSTQAAAARCVRRRVLTHDGTEHVSRARQHTHKTRAL